MSHPLSPFTYCRRNIARIAPMGVAIVLSVFLIAAVVTIVNSIDLTVTTVYNYTKVMTPIIPQRDSLNVDDHDRRVIARTPGIAQAIDSQAMFMNINTVFGQVPFVLIAVTPAERSYLLSISGDRLVEGRMPIPGRPEAVLCRGLIDNRKLRLGGIVAGPTDTGGIAGSPVPIRLVGVLDGPTWIAFTSTQFVESAAPLAPKFLIVTARRTGQLAQLSAQLDRNVDQSSVEVMSYRNLVKQLRTSLASMYLIMGLVNAMVILVVALMSGMLSNIYFTQRMGEFAILSAIGLKRATLLWHAVSETAIVTGIGWAVGLLFTWGALSFLRSRLFEPRGMLINPHDPFAFLYTIPIPLAITFFAVVTIGIRLARFDPVTIIERR